MTIDEGMTKHEGRIRCHSCFVIRHSFVIRAWSFVLILALAKLSQMSKILLASPEEAVNCVENNELLRRVCRDRSPVVFHLRKGIAPCSGRSLAAVNHVAVLLSAGASWSVPSNVWKNASRPM